jgi:hypothetical protein
MIADAAVLPLKSPRTSNALPGGTIRDVFAAYRSQLNA